MIHSTPRFASPATLLGKLAFTRDGTRLLHSIQQQVFVWDMAKTHLRGVVNGELCGVADDGKTFITRRIDQAWVKRDIQARSGFGRQSFLIDPIPEPSFALWEVEHGTPLEFASASPAAYPLHQRTHVMADRYQQVVRLEDVFGISPSRMLDLQSATHEDALLENWLVTPDDQQLAVIYYVSGGGFDWNGGVCVRLEDGQKTYTFEGGRDAFPPYLYFSRKHHWLMSPSGSTLHLYDLSTGNHLNKLPSRVSIATAHPHAMLLVVANGLKITLWSLEPSNTPLWEIKAPADVVDVAFHPQGEQLVIALNTGMMEIRAVKNGRLLQRLDVPKP